MLRIARSAPPAPLEYFAGVEDPGMANVITQQNVHAEEYLPAGAVIVATVFQDTGSTVNLLPSTGLGPSLTVTKLGV